MVHYHNGKQVPAAFDAGASVVHFSSTKGLLMSTLKMTLSLILQTSWLEVKESNVLAVELKVLHLDALRRVAEKASISLVLD
jgi:hypothetical protein